MDVETQTVTQTTTAIASTIEFPYTLHTRLGAGSQGTTWLATHDTSGETVAIKVFRLADASSWKPHELFERECAVLRGLDHPAIPRFIASHTNPDTGEAYLVMSVVDGVPLHLEMGGGQTLSEAEVADILVQLLDVLDYLHSRQPTVIHRDIKPRNLLRDLDGQVSLVDFGGVRVALRPDGGSTTVGTFGYMAPEQLHGAATPASDIYALGASVSALASGCDAADLPRKGLKIDLAQTMKASPLRTLLGAMTEPDPDKRLQDVTAVRSAYIALQEPQPAGATAGAAPSPDEPAVVDRRRRSKLPPGPLGLIMRIVLFALWIASGVAHGALGIVERVVLPARYRQRRKKLGRRFGHRPSRHDALMDKLDARHQQTLGVVRSTRSAMQAVARKSEPYPTPRRDKKFRRRR
ncbi:MAG: serine/threonine protein kinase [Myxococcota bacterium]|jgi:serine/threonine protein kinase